MAPTIGVSSKELEADVATVGFLFGDGFAFGDFMGVRMFGDEVACFEEGEEFLVGAFIAISEGGGDEVFDDVIGEDVIDGVVVGEDVVDL
jgi:hypothetical protein